MSETAKQSRVIAFEGVDGAGKSTVVEIIAKTLAARGVEVMRPRVGKEHRSKPIREIRKLTRDRTNLELMPRAELLLYAAREAQVLDQHIRGDTSEGATVLLDRSMLTPVVLGAYGRGLDLASCEAIARQASAGIEPDLTLIFDVDARTSRIRKRLDKVRNERKRDGGRKGLAGSAFKERIRDGYLALAERDGLPIFHAERATPEVVAGRVLSLLDTGSFEEDPEDALPWWIVDPERPFEAVIEELPELVQLYFTRRMPIGRAVRARLLEREPALAIWAADLEDPLLARAREIAPELVLSRIANMPEAEALRPGLVESHPLEVARSLKRVEGEAADQMRLRLAELDPGSTLESLLGRSDRFALELREGLWKKGDSYERAASLQHCEDPDAWRRRDKLIAKDPAVALPSLVGLDPERIDPILERYADQAPKPVLRALRGRSDAKAHDLRRRLLETGREVIDTILGLDDPGSWALREDCAERWPSSVVRSLLGLEHLPRAQALSERCRAAAPGDLFLTRRLAQLSLDPTE